MFAYPAITLQLDLFAPLLCQDTSDIASVIEVPVRLIHLVIEVREKRVGEVEMRVREILESERG